MPPIDFEALAKTAFDKIKCGLGAEVLYRPKSGGAFTIRGVFDDSAQAVDPDTEQIVSSNLYTLGIKFDDLPKRPEKGDQVKFKGQLYRVIDSLEDGVPNVSTVLVLHKVC